VDVLDEDLNVRIVRVARRIATSSGARLHIAHASSILGESVLACPIRGVSRERLWELRRGIRLERLALLRALADAEAPDLDVTLSVVRGRPGPTVRFVAEQVGADLVVMGPLSPPPLRGVVLTGMAEVLIGSTGYSVLLVGERGDVFA